MSADNGNPPNPPGLVSLIRKIGITAFSSLENRAELLAIELREENIRVVELFIWGLAACFLAMMFLIVGTFTVIYLFPQEYRVYPAIGFCLLYLVGAVLALLNLKALAKNASTPFSDSIGEIKKDAEWLESLK
jgi:uncharacterized membrane protein YqjE